VRQSSPSAQKFVLDLQGALFFNQIMSHPAPIPVTLDLVLLTLGEHQLHVLLRRPERGKWELPWNAVRTGEPMSINAARLARETLGVRPGWLQQVATLDEKRHPAGAGLSVAYTGVVAAGHSRLEELGRKAGADVEWYPVEQLPVLAPRQRLVVESAMASVRTRLDLAPIAFKLLPERFTLSELQEVYELLLARPLHKASFRRALHGARLVAPVAEFRSEGRGRPAQLFRFAPRKRSTARRNAVRFDFLESEA
jgi:8-oxo-dGTP diphosphatase